MDQFILSILANYFSNISYPVLIKIFDFVFKNRPDFERNLKNAKNEVEIIRVLEEINNSVKFETNNGFINLDGVSIDTLSGIIFDNNDGFISIKNSKTYSDSVHFVNNNASETKIKNASFNTSMGSINISDMGEISIGGGGSVTFN
ncbi:MAG: hypothetical protein WC070_02535 [Candidatus Magasanikbacteria bacterium]